MGNWKPTSDGMIIGSSPIMTTNPQPTFVGASSGEGGVHIRSI